MKKMFVVLISVLYLFSCGNSQESKNLQNPESKIDKSATNSEPGQGDAPPSIKIEIVDPSAGILQMTVYNGRMITNDLSSQVGEFIWYRLKDNPKFTSDNIKLKIKYDGRDKIKDKYGNLIKGVFTFYYGAEEFLLDFNKSDYSIGDKMYRGVVLGDDYRDAFSMNEVRKYKDDLAFISKFHLDLNHYLYDVIVKNGDYQINPFELP